MKTTTGIDAWNERYSNPQFAYGEVANAWLIECLPKVTGGAKLLFAAEGEGRNAAYAATNGYETVCFDMSMAGKQKAQLLFSKLGLPAPDYQITDALETDFELAGFDGLVMVYAHFPPAIRALATRHLLSFVKPGGFIVFEAFAEEQLEYQKLHTSGGPREIEWLYTTVSAEREFINVRWMQLEEKEVELSEGAYHAGPAKVVRGFGQLHQ